MTHEGTEPDASAAPEGPPEEEGPPPAVDAGTWNGEGFLNSGFLDGGDFVLRFDTPWHVHLRLPDPPRNAGDDHRRMTAR